MDLRTDSGGIGATGRDAAAIGDRLREVDVGGPLGHAASAMPESETARALGLVALRLREEVTRISHGWEAWGRETEAAARAYDRADDAAAARFRPVPR